MSELMPCPYRVHGERTMSLTVAGEYYYNEYFMPCMKKKNVRAFIVMEMMRIATGTVNT